LGFYFGNKNNRLSGEVQLRVNQAYQYTSFFETVAGNCFKKSVFRADYCVKNGQKIMLNKMPVSKDDKAESITLSSNLLIIFS